MASVLRRYRLDAFADLLEHNRPRFERLRERGSESAFKSKPKKKHRKKKK
jgi:hypothetical protein